MKGSVLTGKTWLLLIAAALLIAAGALNFSQRLRHRPPPWDGVTWIDSELDRARSVPQSDRSGLSLRWLVRDLQAGWPLALRAALCLALSRGVCLSLLHADWNLQRPGLGNCLFAQRRPDHVRAVVPALQRYLSRSLSPAGKPPLAQCVAVFAGFRFARPRDGGISARRIS